jgi:hypothetical protein
MERLSPARVAGIVLLISDTNNCMLMTGGTEETDILPFKKIVKKKNRPEKIGFCFYLNRQKNMPRQISLPVDPQELPVDEWIMPVQPQGYIKCRDKDLL